MFNKDYTLKFTLTPAQLERALESFNIKGVKKIEVDTNNHWHIYYKDKHTKALKHTFIYWQPDSLCDQVKQEYILTGKKRYFEWMGQSYVEKTDDAEWIKAHAINDNPAETVYHTIPEIARAQQEPELKLPDRTENDPIID